jgi:signal transduction histidine kinase
MALAAGILSGVLFLLMCLRSPRNTYAFLLTGIVGCICQWNLTEWFHLRSDNWRLHALKLAGGTLLVPLYFHFAQLVSKGGSHRRWLVLAYGCAGAFLLTILVSTLEERAYKNLYDTDPWNLAFIAFLGVFVVPAVVSLGRRYLAASTGRRGLFGFPLLAGLILAPCGAVAMLPNQPPDVARVGNFGAAAASIILFVAFFKYRGTFDALTWQRESTDRLLGALDRGVVTFDHAGRVIHANDAARTLLGTDVRTTGDAGAEIEALVAEGGERLVRRGPKMLKVGVLREEGPIGADAQVHLLVEDVTRESQLLRDFAQRESLASLGEAAATLAHEIRNPLTAIRATVDALTEGTPPGPEQLALLRQEIARLNAVLERGLTLARPVELELEPCDLERLIERVASLAPPTLPVRLEIDEPIPPIPCDPDLTGQVLLNLLRNAEEAGAEEVWIRAGADPAARLAVLRVSNRGPPIPDEILADLFQPFVTTKRRGGGLGLAMSRKVIHAHGGEIEARNIDGGVEFEVRLPWTS